MKPRPTACLALAAALTLTACAAGGTSAKALRVGVRDDIRGLSYLNETTGQYYGMEVDLANELGRRLGNRQVTFVTVTPDTRESELLSGNVDCVIACYSIDDSRLEKMDFSPAYYEDHGRVMVQSSSLLDELSDLGGKRIGTLHGANAAGKIEEMLRGQGVWQGTELLSYDSYDALSDALESGEADAVCMDGAIAQAYLSDERFLLLESGFSTERYGVATAKGAALSGQVADAVQAMLDDGTVAALADKWDLGGV